MEVAFKALTPEDGLNKRRSIDKKITIDIENKNIIVEGTDYTYSPNGTIISQVPFRYERDNIPEIKEVIAKAAVAQVKDAEGNITTESVAEVIGVAYVAANPRFDIYTASPIGQGIASMIQQTLNNL